MRTAFVTFGCRLNRAEALEQEARLASAGDEIVNVSDSPERIVVRGCSVTARAQHDCEKEIAKLRKLHPESEIVVTGCLPSATSFTVEKTISADALSSRDVSRAHLKVQDGCSGKCTFCIVPQFRGKPVSEPFASVIEKAKAFLEAGFREIVVTGCNLSLWHNDGKGLAALLSSLAELNGPESHRIRLGSFEPGICDDEVVEAFAAHSNLCRFLHLSVQSAADGVLKRMGRPYDAAKLDALCARVRSRLGADFMLGADVIAGFPGESEDEHLETAAFLARHDIANLHVFPYSERPGTPAAKMDGTLPRETRIERAKELVAAGEERRAAFERRFIGRKVEVCVERSGISGWTSEYLHCRLPSPSPRRSLQLVTFS